MSYEEMAYVYDRFMNNVPYDKWIELTELLIKRSMKPVVNVLDLGCGTGEISTKLVEKGYKVTGVDFSVDMLTVAQQKASSQNIHLDLIQQDLKELDGLVNYDLAISFFDVVNYLERSEDVRQVFKNVAHSLSDDGVFIFDVHALSYVKNQMINYTFADVQDDMSYIWFCEEGNEPGEMYHDLTFFIKDNQKYQRFEEFHFQKTLPIQIYKEFLLEAGFEKIEVYADFDLNKNKIQEGAERLFFFAEKKPK